MKKSGFSVAGLIVFIFGAVILALAFFLLAPLFVNSPADYCFSCISVSLVYIMYFLPFFVGSMNSDIATLAVSGTIYYRGVVAYTVVSVVNIILTFLILPLPLSIVIQGVALFILLIRIFAALFTKSHIEYATSSEEQTKSLVMELRSKAARLISLTAGLDRSNAVRVRAEKLAEDMRYLSPGTTAQARELERKLITVLDTILMDGALTSVEPGASEPLLRKFNDFDVLYRERKGIH